MKFQNFYSKGFPPEGTLVSKDIEYATIDSGACENICPNSCFPNTPLMATAECGFQYGACGGETVTNIGQKPVEFITTNNETYNIDFQGGRR